MVSNTHSPHDTLHSHCTCHVSCAMCERVSSSAQKGHSADRDRANKILPSHRETRSCLPIPFKLKDLFSLPLGHRRRSSRMHNLCSKDEHLSRQNKRVSGHLSRLLVHHGSRTLIRSSRRRFSIRGQGLLTCLFASALSLWNSSPVWSSFPGTAQGKLARLKCACLSKLNSSLFPFESQSASSL